MHYHNPGATDKNQHSKDAHFQDQFKIIYDGFYKQPQTMKELSVRTGIDRANICWYCRTMRKLEKIAVTKKPIAVLPSTWPTSTPLTQIYSLFNHN
jgi:hypothetical protein